MKSKFAIAIVPLVLALSACTAPNNNSIVRHDNQAGIIGGQYVETEDLIAKSTVGLVATVIMRETEENKNLESRSSSFICTGTLLSDNIVLTAGHCIPEVGEEFETVRVFVIFKDDINKATREDARLVEDYRIHSQYDQKGPLGEDMNDIALLRFEGTKPANYNVAKFLPTDTWLVPGTIVTLAGYGLYETDGVTTKSDERLRKVDVKVAENFGKTELVLDQRFGKGACHGDSGGPAFLTIDNVPYVWGITSRGAGKNDVDDCSLYSVYTKFNTQLDFLIQALMELEY